MTRLQFFGALFLIGVAGIHHAVSTRSDPSSITRTLADTAPSSPQENLGEALVQVEKIARTDGTGTKPLIVRLRAMPSQQGLEAAIDGLHSDSQTSLADRLQIISFLREIESDFPDTINDVALRELSLKRIPKTAPVTWTESYIGNVAHLYLETKPNAENELEQLSNIAESYSNPTYQKALLGAYLELFPERKPEVDQRLGGDSANPPDSTAQ